MTVAAFVPLKGHSARIPGKNLRQFGGRPLFHTIVTTLQTAELVDSVYIDTDSDEIAESAASLPEVSVIRRKPELIGDEVSVNLLIEDFLLEHEGVEHFIQTHSTNPLLSAKTIDAAIDRYMSDDAATSVFSVTRIQARVYDANLGAINHDPSELIPTQDLDPVFLENSNFYICGREAFFENRARISSLPAIYEMDPFEAVDIDEEKDFELAEALYLALLGS